MINCARIVLLILLLLALSACSRQDAAIVTDNAVLIGDDAPPLAELPPEEAPAAEEPFAGEAEEAGEAPEMPEAPEMQQLAENVQVAGSLETHQAADEGELLGAADMAVEMYRSGDFPPGEEKRYPALPEGCSMDSLGDISIEADQYIYPFCAMASFDNGTEMIMGMEYIAEEDATGDRPEGWSVAAVLFREG
jgi:hypothetical protein